MAEIKSYTLNFSYGRAQGAHNFACAKLAFAEIERGFLVASRGSHG